MEFVPLKKKKLQFSFARFKTLLCYVSLHIKGQFLFLF